MKTRIVIILTITMLTGAFATLSAQGRAAAAQHVGLGIIRIDSAAFYHAGRTASRGGERPEAITDIEMARKMLDGRVEWGFVSDNGDIAASDNGEVLCCIEFGNGERYWPEPYDDQYFVAYYPSEDILLLEGGHTTDISYDLTTGETTEYVGNPSYIVSSPSGKYRLNGHYGGQECSFYFIQKREGSRYRKIAQLDSVFEEATGKWLCTIGEAFWTDDDALYFLIQEEGGRIYYRVYLIDENIGL